MANQSIEESIVIIDESGQVKTEKVVYTVSDVFDEKVYVTKEGLQYTRDSLYRKRQGYFISQLKKISQALSHPDIVIRDPHSPKDTLIYYKRYYSHYKGRYLLMAVIIKVNGVLKFLYNAHPQQSGKVKGYRELPKPEILYLNPKRKRRHFGL